MIDFLDANLYVNTLIASILFGFSFGFGVPSSFAYFADCTIFENRGRNSGLVFALSNLAAFLFLIFIGEDLFGFILIASIWRTLGLCVLLLIRPKNIEKHVKDYTSFKSILHNRSFTLFVIPWLLFCLVDNIEKPYFISLAKMSGATGEEFIAFDEVFEPLVGTLFAFVGGFIADYIGRKKVIIYSFISLGIAFAALSVAPTIQAFWYVTSAVDGIAWGIFDVVFILVLWGDLSPPDSIREKYFALGCIPFFLAKLLGIIVYPFAQEVSRETIYAAFPIASFFLFLAVLPLMYAPETLPEKKIRERELKQYIENAKKVKEKYA
jgi:MFS family permease